MQVILSLFSDFLGSTITEKDLIQSLNEYQLFSLGDGEFYWFKFFKNDAGATTITDITLDLKSGVNRQHIIDCMQLAVDNPSDFQIFVNLGID